MDPLYRIRMQLVLAVGTGLSWLSTPTTISLNIAATSACQRRNRPPEMPYSGWRFLRPQLEALLQSGEP